MIYIDVNDFQERIDMLYYSTNDFVARTPVAPISVEEKEEPNGIRRVSFGGGEITKAEMQAAKHTFTDMISRLANLKDLLKDNLEKIGLKKNLAEKCINNSIHLQIIIDLNNAQKHRYPIDNKRSGIDPLIGNIRKEMVIPLVPGRFTNALTDSIVVFEADILDLEGNKAHDYRTLIEQGLIAWEDFCINNFPEDSVEMSKRRHKKELKEEWEKDHFARGEQVNILLNDPDTWFDIKGSEILPNMLVKATNKKENSIPTIGYPSRPLTEWERKNNIPLTDLEYGNQVWISKTNNDWTVFTAEKIEDIRLVSDYFWELWHPPSFG